MAHPQRLSKSPLAVDPEARPCPECGQLLYSASGLVNHQRRRGPHTTPTIRKRVTTDSAYPCDQADCMYAGFSNEALSKHLYRTHGIDNLRTSVRKRFRVKERAAATGQPRPPSYIRDEERGKVRRAQNVHRVTHEPKSKDTSRFVEGMLRTERGKDSRDWRPVFLQAFAKTGYLGDAQAAADVGDVVLARVKAEEPEFMRQVMAIANSIQLRRKEEAIKAAIEDGVTGRMKGVYHNGELVAQELVRDTGMTRFLLEWLAPQEFDKSARASALTNSILMASAEERRAQLDAVKGILSDMVPSRRRLGGPTEAIEATVVTDGSAQTQDHD